jgi:chromosome segregation ATPase
MKESDKDETAVAGGRTADEAKPRRRGRPRIYSDDAARKRAFNRRRAEAHARARASERRATRWKEKAKQLEQQLGLAHHQSQALHRLATEQEARLRSRIERLEDQLARAVRRKEWAVESRAGVVAENRQLREALQHAWRIINRLEANPRLGPLAARIRE